MKKNALVLALFVASNFFFTSCEKDTPILINEEEIITTVKYTLTPRNGGSSILLQFQDLDGDGGNAPIYTTKPLAANTIYDATIEVLNERSNTNITNEIITEALAHQFFYQTTVDGLSIQYNDEDANKKPLGVKTIITTTASAQGNLTLILRHEPNKSGSNVDKGDITKAGGSTDIEVTFTIDVQ